MASIQARHQPRCAIVKARHRLGRGGSWSSFAEAHKQHGGADVVGSMVRCTCTPTFWLAHRDDGDRQLKRVRVGTNRLTAERARLEHEKAVADESYVPGADSTRAAFTFAEWADIWIANADVKPTTRNSYVESLTLAKSVFGSKRVAALGKRDITELLKRAREDYRKRRPPKEGEAQREISPATLARHLRQLGACLQAAIPEHAPSNPVRALSKTERPKVPKSRPSYFTDGELGRFWPELADRPVYLAVCKTAVATGARFGELSALTWSDVDLLDRRLHIRRSHDKQAGILTPKSGEERTVDLTPQAAHVLEDWLAVSGGAAAAGLVFEREEGGYLDDDYIRKCVVYPAMARAGIPRVGEGGRNRTFHSFRHTFARITLENAAPIDWVRRQLGHSSIQLTVEVYGAWSRSAEKAEAEKLAGVFPV